MAYPQYDYGSALPSGRQQYTTLDDDSRYPASSAQNPFASQTSFHQGGAVPEYPPAHQAMYSAPHANDSTWSLEEDRSPFGDNAKEGAAGIQRGRDNPYAQDYKQKGAWKKWTFIGLLVLLIVGGVAGGIAAWRVTSSNKNNSSGSTSTGSNSGKLQYSESDWPAARPRASNQAGRDNANAPLDSCMASRWHGQGGQVEPERPFRVPTRQPVRCRLARTAGRDSSIAKSERMLIPDAFATD